jgi:hypothetical protein
MGRWTREGSKRKQKKIDLPEFRTETVNLIFAWGDRVDLEFGKSRQKVLY